jgi:hypothetical protein
MHGEHASSSNGAKLFLGISNNFANLIVFSVSGCTTNALAKRHILF